MNILIVYHRIPVPTSGGIARIVSMLADELRLDNHKVWFLSYRNTIVSLENRYQLFVDEKLSDEIKITQIVDLCKKHSIDIIADEEPIDGYSMHNILVKVKQAYGCKLISCFHNPVTSQVLNIHYRKEFYLKKYKLKFVQQLINYSLVRKFLLQIYRLKYIRKYLKIVNDSDMNVVLCEGMRKELQQMIGHGNFPHRIIPNFCNKIDEVLEYENKTKTIVWCGNVNFDIKRLDIALDIWKRVISEIPDWKLLILGDGKEIEDAKEYANSLGLKNLEFLGRVSPDLYYKKARMVWITSSFESFSLVTLEALSYGCIPIVFNTFPAASELIKNDENGYIINPYDIKGFANRVISLASDNSLASEVSKKAVASSSSYYPSKIVCKWTELINYLY